MRRAKRQAPLGKMLTKEDTLMSGSGMMGWGWNGMGGVGWLSMVLVLGLIIVGLVLVVRRL